MKRYLCRHRSHKCSRRMSRITLRLFTLVLGCVGISSCNSAKSYEAESARIRAKLDAIPLDEKVQFTNDEWKYILTSLQYYVLRRKGTELPFANAYWHTHEHGTYICAACGNPLFSSEAKYDSGTVSPCLWQPMGGEPVKTARHPMLGRREI